MSSLRTWDVLDVLVGCSPLSAQSGGIAALWQRCCAFVAFGWPVNRGGFSPPVPANSNLTWRAAARRMDYLQTKFHDRET